jgi:Male sterility protein
MDHETVEKNTTKLIKGYPNTYTYTKSMAERHLERYRGNLRIVINRPTAVIGCVKDPIEGWLDSMSAIAAVGFPVGMGMMKTVFYPDQIHDLIPGDITSNAVLATTAYSASLPEPTFKIYHNASATTNPFRIYDFWNRALEYLKYIPFEKQIRDPRWYPVDTQ